MTQLLNDSLLQLPDVYEVEKSNRTVYGCCLGCPQTTVEIAAGKYYKYCTYTGQRLAEAGRYQVHAERIVRRFNETFFGLEHVPEPIRIDTTPIRNINLELVKVDPPPPPPKKRKAGRQQAKN